MFGRARRRLAEAPCVQLGSGDPLFNEVGNHCLCAAQAQLEVVLGFAPRVGVAVDEHAELGMGADEVGHLVEHGSPRRQDHRASVGEQHVAFDGQHLEIVRKRIALEAGDGDRQPARPGEIQRGGDRPCGDDRGQHGHDDPTVVAVVHGHSVGTPRPGKTPFGEPWSRR